MKGRNSTLFFDIIKINANSSCFEIYVSGFVSGHSTSPVTRLTVGEWGVWEGIPCLPGWRGVEESCPGRGRGSRPVWGCQGGPAGRLARTGVPVVFLNFKIHEIQISLVGHGRGRLLRKKKKKEQKIFLLPVVTRYNNLLLCVATLFTPISNQQ